MGFSFQAIIQRPLAVTNNIFKLSLGGDARNTETNELSTARLVALTCSIGGLQTVWLTIFSHGSSYLSSLGISEVHTSLIWTTAPICGVIVAPIVGVVSDSSRISWGRRRPFILMGALTIMFAISALAWIEPITELACSLHGEPSMAPFIMQYWAVFWITFLNVGIQSMQSGIRSLIVDIVPSEQQSMASAWAGRFTGAGNILGYLLGSLPLPFLTGNVEAWRFRCMSFFAVTVLSITTTITMYCTHEEVPDMTCSEEELDDSMTATFKDVIQAIRSMPPRARSVCRVQFFSAMGWFEFLFYSTSYVSYKYLEERNQDIQSTAHSATHKASSMRFATTASLLFAIVALSMNLILPHLRRTSGIDFFAEKGNVMTWLHSLRQINVLWAMGQFLYFALTLSTLFISSSTSAASIIAIAGIAWGVTQWAPYALLGEEIAHQHSSSAHPSSIEEVRNKDTFPVTALRNRNGAMLGVHTVAVSVPQILASVLSSGVFWGAGVLGCEDKVGLVLRCSGVAGAVAGWLAWGM